MDDFDDNINDTFDKAIMCATSQIEEEYFKMPECGGRRIWRERVYCYEFYHQLRNILCINSYFQNFALSGEVYKGRPRVPKGETRVPDFIVHVPDTTINYAVFEVKPVGVFDENKTKAICKDFKSLKYFSNNCRFNYERAIFLIFGEPKSRISLKKRLRILDPNGIKTNGIEIWHHKRVGEHAECLN